MGQYPNSGIISKNDRKETDSHPDYKGSAEIDGVDYWLDCWINERNDGSGKFLKISFKPKVSASSCPAEVHDPTTQQPSDDIGW